MQLNAFLTAVFSMENIHMLLMACFMLLFLRLILSFYGSCFTINNTAEIKEVFFGVLYRTDSSSSMCMCIMAFINLTSENMVCCCVPHACVKEVENFLLEKIFIEFLFRCMFGIDCKRHCSAHF